MSRFDGSVALVTGAARPRSIGRATALRLAADGADVACLDIARPYDDAPAHGVATADDLDSLVAEVEALGRRAVALRADVSDAAAVEDAVDQATDALGTVTRVANVAGGSGPGFGLGPLVALSEAEFRRVFEVNVTGTWLVSKACASRMVAAGVPGRICNVSSQAGKKAWPMIGAYSAAKAAVISLTQAMAIELGPSGISVNAVCPGTVDTELTNPNGMMRTAMGDQAFDEWIAREIPLGRLQTAEEIAAAICWLLDDDAAGVTGEAMNVSAGQTMV
ncbi:MAG TPA: SDR family NAD(P)-dependent oxidoreductase [Acidimicrobiales bacterium]|nr:SDR family NAD(P)-dependent oxidoreductase [Acidimicrobiales bacterium]